MGAAALKPPLAIPLHSKLWGFLAFSREFLILVMIIPDYFNRLFSPFLYIMTIPDGSGPKTSPLLWRT